MPLRGNLPRVGLLGAGQLGRMLFLAGTPLGVRFVQLAPEPEAANEFIDTIAADFTDRAALRELAGRVDVVTYESENIPLDAVEFLARHVPIRPPPGALAAAGDRWAEKDLFTRLDIPTAPYARVAGPHELRNALEVVGLPAVLKTRRLGYDGRGQTVCRSEEELFSGWDRLGGVPLLCERWIGFHREISIVAVRSHAGEVRCYAVSENVHEHGILRSTIAPAPDLAAELTAIASTYVGRIVDAMDHVGVLALEMFQHGDGLMANEIAPRVHNTGHWTIEGAETSQFENHLRAILGWPLGSTAQRSPAVMLNVIGETPDITELLAVPGAHAHVYAKRPRAGRKLGHITALVQSPQDGQAKLAELRGIVDRFG
jgi:5-(carboxyamino)imidazole ribonucleotide synthase